MTQPPIPTCINCGRCIGDYHDPDCPYRGECNPFVRDYNCEVYQGDFGREGDADYLHPYERDDFEEYLFPQGE